MLCAKLLTLYYFSDLIFIIRTVFCRHSHTQGQHGIMIENIVFTTTFFSQIENIVFTTKPRFQHRLYSIKLEQMEIDLIVYHYHN